MDLIPNLAPTAEVPLLKGSRLEFAKAFKAEASPIQLMTLFPGIFDDLRKEDNSHIIALTSTKEKMAKMEGISPNCVIWALFHSIPRLVVESIVLGTVGHDVAKDNIEGYTDKGGGVYVLGVTIDGRDGAFLNVNEYAELLTNLKSYLQGCGDIFSPQAGRTAQQKGASKAFIDQIDNFYGENTDPHTPRWVREAQSFQLTKQFFNSLRARYQALREVDKTHLVYSAQGPQYVGCSKDVETRVRDYIPHKKKSALRNANKMLGLLLCLLGYQGLKPQVQHVTAIRTWAEDQLSEAEMLVTLLASGYVTQGGMNKKEAGQTKEEGFRQTPKTIQHSEEYVLGAKEDLKRNLDHSLKDIDLLEHLEGIRTRVEGLPRRVERLREKSINAERGFQRTKVDMMDVTEEQADAVRKRVEEAEMRLNQIREGNRLLKETNEWAQRLENEVIPVAFKRVYRQSKRQ
ncbi:hypothetical protein QBC44DRAFT_310648 [Cladorrhinum sp. PSN332]|nr:hypothetical protein QBC44DRAFT_310648 [Cladorrhinum sp. PSN332]